MIGNQFNADKLRTSGIDIDMKWNLPATSISLFKLGMNGTYVIEYKQTLLPIQTTHEAAAGARGPFFGAISRWRHYATVDWTYGAWGATLAQTFQDGYSEPCITVMGLGTIVERRGRENAGEYVALDGDRLLAHHTDGREVLKLARAQGVEAPFVFYTPPADEPPFGGW